MQYGEKVSQAREKLAISQGEVCKRVEQLAGWPAIKQNYLSMVESCQRTPKKNIRAYIAQVLKRPYEDLEADPDETGPLVKALKRFRVLMHLERALWKCCATPSSGQPDSYIKAAGIAHKDVSVARSWVELAQRKAAASSSQWSCDPPYSQNDIVTAMGMMSQAEMKQWTAEVRDTMARTVRIASSGLAVWDDAHWASCFLTGLAFDYLKGDRLGEVEPSEWSCPLGESVYFFLGLFLNVGKQIEFALERKFVNRVWRECTIGPRLGAFDFYERRLAGGLAKHAYLGAQLQSELEVGEDHPDLPFDCPAVIEHHHDLPADNTPEYLPAAAAHVSDTIGSLLVFGPTLTAIDLAAERTAIVKVVCCTSGLKRLLAAIQAYLEQDMAAFFLRLFWPAYPVMLQALAGADPALGGGRRQSLSEWVTQNSIHVVRELSYFAGLQSRCRSCAAAEGRFVYPHDERQPTRQSKPHEPPGDGQAPEGTGQKRAPSSRQTERKARSTKASAKRQKTEKQSASDKKTAKPKRKRAAT